MQWPDSGTALDPNPRKLTTTSSNIHDLMEGNKDEALRCCAIAQKHFDAGNIPSARKFCQKSISLFETPQALKLLTSINATPESSSSNSAQSSATEAHPSATGTKQRSQQSKTSSTANGTASGINGEKRDFTPEQHATVKRVRACKATEYYEILALKKDCEEGDVKKAYRKLALALHPDKNGAPGADEAFKLVSKAFQILSDSQKRAIYDRSGADPESRFGGMSSPSGPSMNRFSGEGEMSPEELFNMFFGGGGGGSPFGGPFGGGQVFSASFGPGGFTTMRMGRQPRARNAQVNERRSLFLQLLPLFILFGISLLSALPSLFTTPPVPDPRYSFHGTRAYNVERKTERLGIRYFVNGPEFTKHPVIGAEMAREKSGQTKGQRGPGLVKFEGTVEQTYTQDLYLQCQRGVDRRDRRKEAEIGVFGIGTDWEKVRQIEQEKVEACEELKRLGVLKDVD